MKKQQSLAACWHCGKDLPPNFSRVVALVGGREVTVHVSCSDSMVKAKLASYIEPGVRP